MLRANLYLFYFAISSILLMTNCTIFYSTSDINKSLNEMVISVSKHHESVAKSNHKIKNEYGKLRSDNLLEPFLSAYNKINKLEENLTEITQMKNNVNNEYNEFLIYSKGINKIASNSKEWDYLKQTKKNMKLLKKEITKKGKVYKNKAEHLGNFLNKEVVPLVKIYKVSDYKEKHVQIISSIKKTQKEINKELNNYESILKNLRNKFSRSHVEQCKQLDLQLKLVKEEVEKIRLVAVKINKLFKNFNEITNKFTEIYNTYPEWASILVVEAQIDGQIKSIKSIQNVVKKHLLRFQSIANEINPQ